jgi:hypothetical protein
MAYLRGHYEPEDELEEKRLKQRARGYTVVNGELYKSGVTKPWLRCITSEKGRELLKEIHSRFCGAHIGTRALAGKAIKKGFYCPTINIDAKMLVRQCEACQKMGNQQNLPSMPVHLIPPTRPLQRWGMDLVGPLPTAHRRSFHQRWGMDLRHTGEVFISISHSPMVQLKEPTT